MINKFKEMAKREEGFTLVELLVVILIIAILAAAAVAAFLSQQDKARQSAGEQALQTAFKAAKAESVLNDGNYSGGTVGTAGQLAAAIEAGEPALTVDVSSGLSTSTTGLTEGTIYIDTAGTTGDNVKLAIDSEGDSGVTTLTVTGNGQPVIARP